MPYIKLFRFLGVCRTGSKRQPRPRKPSVPAVGSEMGGGGLKRSPSTYSTTSTASGYRPRSSPAGLYSYTGGDYNDFLKSLEDPRMLSPLSCYPERISKRPLISCLYHKGNLCEKLGIRHH